MDRRATKNRKLKYLTFEKIVNFMVPLTNELELPNINLVKKALFNVKTKDNTDASSKEIEIKPEDISEEEIDLI